MKWLNSFFSMALLVIFHHGQYCCQADQSSPTHHCVFAKTNGTHFVVNNKPLYLNGFNAFWMMYMSSDPSTRSKVTSAFQQASEYGMNIARTWAFSDGGNDKPLQISPGIYNEDMFKVYFSSFLEYFRTINSSRAVACRISIYVLTILLSRDWTSWYQKLGNMGFIWYWAWWITSRIMGADHNMLSGQGNVISSWVMTTGSIQTLLSKNTTRTMSR